MKLTELNPRILTRENNAYEKAEHDILIFRCPAHLDAEHDEVAIRITAGEEAKDSFGFPVWKKSGNGFEDLTLTPSVNYVGHWHGYVTNGEVSTV